MPQRIVRPPCAACNGWLQCILEITDVRRGRMLPCAFRLCARHWKHGRRGGGVDDDGRGGLHVVVEGLRRDRRRGRRFAVGRRGGGGGGRLVPLQEGAGIHRLLDELLGQLSVEARVRLVEVGLRWGPLRSLGAAAAMLLPPL